jgi:hypothetical protein
MAKVKMKKKFSVGPKEEKEFVKSMDKSLKESPKYQEKYPKKKK